MGSLYETIKADIKQAMLSENNKKRDILRVVIGEVQRKVDADSDEDVQRVMRKIIEGNNETLKSLTEERAFDLRLENEILARYLPKVLTQDDVERFILLNILEQVKGAKSDGMAMGIVMKAAKAESLAVDGNDVKAVVAKLRSK